MDKRIILAVAGSGKTTYIINKLCLSKRHLVLCYTIENYNILRKKIIKKFNYFPPNISLFRLFSFLYSFCYRPLCIGYAKNNLSFYKPNTFAPDIDSTTKQIYHSRLSKVILKEELRYLDRINKYFDSIFIDEAQDFASYDFDWLLSLAETDKSVLAVGDFYQHTFDSSTCGNKNINIYKDKQKYLKKFNNKFDIDTETLSKSYRCSPSICDFISNNIGIKIESHNTGSSEVVLVEDDYTINSIIENHDIKKLFYKEHYKYSCRSNNWGNCKGSSYTHVCVVLNPETVKAYKGNKLADLKPATRAKFYVACSRTKGNLYFIEQSKITAYKKIA